MAAFMWRDSEDGARVRDPTLLASERATEARLGWRGGRAAAAPFFLLAFAAAVDFGERAENSVRTASGGITVVEELTWFTEAASATVSIRFSEGEPVTIVAALDGVTMAVAAGAAAARTRSTEAPRVRPPL
jgi:hypothetical protein